MAEGEFLLFSTVPRDLVENEIFTMKAMDLSSFLSYALTSKDSFETFKKDILRKNGLISAHSVLISTIESGYWKLFRFFVKRLNLLELLLLEDFHGILGRIIATDNFELFKWAYSYSKRHLSRETRLLEEEACKCRNVATMEKFLIFYKSHFHCQTIENSLFLEYAARHGNRPLINWILKEGPISSTSMKIVARWLRTLLFFFSYSDSSRFHQFSNCIIASLEDMDWFVTAYPEIVFKDGNLLPPNPVSPLVSGVIARSGKNMNLPLLKYIFELTGYKNFVSLIHQWKEFYSSEVPLEIILWILEFVRPDDVPFLLLSAVPLWNNLDLWKRVSTDPVFLRILQHNPEKALTNAANTSLLMLQEVHAVLGGRLTSAVFGAAASKPGSIETMRWLASHKCEILPEYALYCFLLWTDKKIGEVPIDFEQFNYLLELCRHGHQARMRQIPTFSKFFEDSLEYMLERRVSLNLEPRDLLIDFIPSIRRLQSLELILSIWKRDAWDISPDEVLATFCHIIFTGPVRVAKRFFNEFEAVIRSFSTLAINRKLLETCALRSFKHEASDSLAFLFGTGVTTFETLVDVDDGLGMFAEMNFDANTLHWFIHLMHTKNGLPTEEELDEMKLIKNEGKNYDSITLEAYFRKCLGRRRRGIQ